MKVSLNSIKELTSVDLSVDELVEKIGAQLGAVEEVVDLGKRYQGIVIAKVIDCEKIEGSDHLSLCKIDDGGKVQNVERDEDRRVQVVCGAPNCREGLTVTWIPPGVTVPSTANKDPFVLEVRDIRGHKSNGMLASPSELALSDNHDGLLEIEGDAKPGDDFAKVYQLDDVIIDIENKMFTHRPDCFGQLGVAREIAGIQQKAFTSPDWYTASPQVPHENDQTLNLEIRNELPELVPRFTAVAMAEVSIKSSPVWLQSWLSRLGIRPINNVVDLTNYYMLLTAQPLHAYDYDKVQAMSSGTATLAVRHPHQNEKITLLGGKEVTPPAEAIMIATDKQAIGIGGVMGGHETEVDGSTKNIILECATFDMYSIRRTAMELGIFTDAATRFTKGQSPLQNLAVLLKIVTDLKAVAGGQIASPVIDPTNLQGDVLRRASLYPPVLVSASFINDRLGEQLSAEEMATLLKNVEFDVQISGEALTIKAPFWRTDIEIPEDIVEEVGRLHGYDKLPLELPKRDLTPAPKDPMLELKAKVRDVLADAGANEVLTYSFVHGNLLDKVGQSRDQAFQLANALSPDLQYYRLSLTPSLLEKVHPNIKAGYDEFALFEMGKGHNLKHKDDDNGLPMEFEMLDVVYAADKKSQSGTAFFEARKYLTRLAEALGVSLGFRPLEAEEDYAVAKPYDHARSAQVFVKGTDLPLGMVGEYKASVRRNLKLPPYCAGFGLGLTQLLQALNNQSTGYVPLSRFPKVEQDMTLKVSADLLYQDLFTFVQEKLNELKPQQTYFALTPLDIFQREDDQTHEQVTFRLSIASYEKTMRDEEVNKLLDEVAVAAKDKWGAERV